jgi:nucleotide-binding universal stress UspA family protein
MDFAVSRILVPLDFSPHSELALRCNRARRPSRRPDRDLSGGGRAGRDHDLGFGDLNSGSGRAPENLIAEAERQLDDYRSASGRSDVRTVTTVRAGDPAQTITAYANTAAIDLIVMGTHGRSGLSHLAMGSVAQRVARYAPCPVLTLHDRGAHASTESVPAVEHAALGSVLGRHGTSRE